MARRAVPESLGYSGKAGPAGTGSSVTAADNDPGFGAPFADFEVTVGGPRRFRPKLFWTLALTALKVRPIFSAMALAE
jgi:hypothetical protein